MLVGEFVIILILMMLNGVFSMSEAAIIAARRARLQHYVERGDRRAQAALALVDEPERLLSTVQVGITLIGILTGVFGGATLTEELARTLAQSPLLAPYAQALAFALIVLLTTYLSLIIGELVPKSLALRNPEGVALAIAQPMTVMTRLTSPLVSLLSTSTNAVLRLLGINERTAPPVTEHEITAMVEQGVSAGVFVVSEHELIKGVFRLSDRRASQVMTPRTSVAWFDIDDDHEAILDTIATSEQSRYPVADGDLDHVAGVVRVGDLFVSCMRGQTLNLRAHLIEPLFVPESLSAAKVLELFQEQDREIAFVTNEHGGIEGLITVHDLLQQIAAISDDDPDAVLRDDGSWLVDGRMPVDNLKTLLGVEADLPAEAEYETLGGFVMAQLERVPRVAEHFDWSRWTFEVIDMDGNRVDKVLISAKNDDSALQ